MITEKDEVEVLVVGNGKATDKTEAVAKEKVVVVEEDVVAIRINHTTPGIVLKSKIFIGISEVTIGMICREKVKHMLAANAAVEGLVADMATTAHMGDVAQSLQ